MTAPTEREVLEALIATIPGGSALEGLLHSRFDKLRKHREWFRDDGSIRRFIKRKVWAGEATAFDWRLHHLTPEFRAHWEPLRTFGPCLTPRRRWAA